MTDARERFQAAADLFLAARDVPAERVAAFLEAACGGDADLLHQVRDLLANADESNVFATLAGRLRPAVDRLRGGVDQTTIGSSGVDLTSGPASASAFEHIETRIGNYELKERVGEGGFGQVWVAEQREPVRRRVAIKVIKPGMDSREVLTRFNIERQALALMDHPHIAKVFDAGMTERGRPYFVMEYVPGLSITSFCDTVRLRIHDRLKLFGDVCRAVQHAHLRGVIHRDLKPSNVLVTMVDGQPTPKIIDFGVAKATAARLTNDSLFTEMGRIIGTPAYMSPEQAGSGGADIDTRSDVYSLGVILYQLLTGTTPLDEKMLREAGFDGIARLIREMDPPRPSTRFSTLLSEPANRGDVTPAHIANLHGTDIRTLQRELRGELDWIVMKCLEKDRTRRYESVNELASDVQRYLAGEPIVAAPPGAAYRLTKFVRRHRLLITAAATVLTTLVVGLGVSMVLFFQERDARRRAVAAEAEQSELRQQADASRTSEAMQRRNAEQISTFLQEMLSAIQPQRARGKREITVAEALDEASARVQRGEFGAEPEVLAALENVIGLTYRKLGKYDQALAHVSAAVKLRRELFGPEHADVASSLFELGSVYYEKGEYDAAEKSFLETLAMREKLSGTDSEETAVVQHHLGKTCLTTGRLDEAQRWNELSLRTLRARLAPQHFGLSGPLADLGGVAYQRGDYSVAENLWTEALDIRLKSGGEDDADVGGLYNNLATIRSSRGDYPGAIEFHRKALAVRRKMLGPEHAEVAHSLRNLAMCVYTFGDLVEGEALFHEAIEIQRVALGPDHPQLASSLESLGTLLRAKGQLSEARDLINQALEMRQRSLGPNHPAISQSMLYLGLIQLDEGKFAEARAGFEEALQSRRRVLGRDDVLVGELLVNSGRASAGEKDLARAEQLLQAGAQCLRTVGGPRSPRVAGALHHLGAVLSEKGDTQGAEAAYSEALDLFRAARMGEKREAITCMTRLAEFHQRRGERSEAEELLLAALSIQQKKLPEDHPELAATRSALAALQAEPADPSPTATRP